MKRMMLIALLLIAAALPLSAAGYTKNVAIMLYNGVEVLDFAGPAEVFAAAAYNGANGRDRAFNVYTVSKTKAPIVSQGFIDVTPDYSIEDAPKPDVLVLPGGGAEAVISDPEWMAWIKNAAENGDHVLTVCTGAFIAGKLGMLDGLDVTTWYNAVPALASEYPKARVQPGRRFIDNGKIITTAGVSAGIDGALHLVAKLNGRYVADRTAEYMEYAWAPQSYTSSTYAMLNPRLDAHGRKLQEATIAARGGDRDGAIAIYRELIAKNASDAEAWMSLGRLQLTAKRYPDAISAFTEAAKGDAQRSTALYNLACAYALAGERDKAVDAVGRAVAAGFRSKAALQGDPDLASIRDDGRFKELIAKM